MADLDTSGTGVGGLEGIRQPPWFLASRSSRTDPHRDWYVWPSGSPPTPAPSCTATGRCGPPGAPARRCTAAACGCGRGSDDVVAYERAAGDDRRVVLVSFADGCRTVPLAAEQAVLLR